MEHTSPTTPNKALTKERYKKPEQDLADQVEGLFNFSNKLVGAYKEYRYKNTPGMERAHPESIAEHMWDVVVTWRNIELTCPNLASAIDGGQVSRMLSIHDMGEIEAGDIDRIQQMNGAGVDKSEQERKAIIKITASLPPRVAEEYLKLYDQYEDDETPEAWMAHIVDSMSGTTHFCDNAESPQSLQNVQVKMHERYMVPRIQKMIAYLEATEQKEAFEEFMDMLVGFCNYIRRFGIDINPLQGVK